MRQGDRHGPRAGARFEDALSRADAHRHQDEADVFGIQDLRIARQFVEQVRERRLEQKERRADVTENLRAPRQADQVVVFEHAAMGLQFTVGDERKDEMLVPQADQLRDLAGRGVGGGGIPGHGFILPCSRWVGFNSLPT